MSHILVGARARCFESVVVEILIPAVTTPRTQRRAHMRVQQVRCALRYGHDGQHEPCDCGRGKWCPQYGTAFRAARLEAGRRGTVVALDPKP